MQRRFLALAVAAVAPLVSSALAAIPTGHVFQLQARAATGGTAFNLPDLSTLSNTSPVINDAGTIAFRAATVANSTNDGIWSGNHGAGDVVLSQTSSGLISSTIGLNNASEFAFAISDIAPGPGFGIYKWSFAMGTSTLVSSGPPGASFWTPRINNSGQIGARASVGGANVYASYAGTPATVATHAAEVGADATSPYSFLFSPNFDDQRRIAGVVRVGAAGSSGDATRPDQLRRFNVDGTSTLLAEDKDSNAASPFFQFDATAVGMSDSGQYTAFVARTTSAASSRTVFLNNGTTSIPVGTPGSGLLSIDNFSPAVNDDGLAVFRATDTLSRISVFLGDGTSVVRLFGVGDTIETDLGPRTISFLAGNPDINNLGEVAFSAQLNNGGNVVIAAYIPEPASLATALLGLATLRRRR